MISRLRQWFRDMSEPVVLVNDQPILVREIIQRGDELCKAGDRIAHELMFREHPEILKRWWTARGGVCSVCDDKHD